MERIGNFIFKHARLVIAFVVLINLVSLGSLYRFNFDTDFLSSFNEGNEKAEQYDQLIEKYDTGEPVTILVENDTSLLDKANMLALYELQESVAGIDGIVSLQGPLPASIQVGDNAVPLTADIIEAQCETISTFIDTRYFMTDQIYSEDRKAATLILMLDPEVEAAGVIDSLRDLTDEQTALEMSLAGNEVIKDTLWDFLVKIVFIIPPAVVVLILTVFTLMLRNFKMAVLSMIPAGMGALWTLGTILWSGNGLGLTTILAPIFVIVVGSAYGLHYTSHLMNHIAEYPDDRRKLTVETLKIVGTPIFLAVITTVAGFASLTWTEVLPMRQIGIYVSLGIAYSGFIALFFLPSVLTRIKLPQKTMHSGDNRLSRMVIAASRKRVLIVLTFLAIIGVSAFYIPKIDVVSDQLMYFKESSEIRQTFDKVEEHFGGAVPLIGEIASENPQAALMDAQYAEKILAVERELEEQHGISTVFSVFDMVSNVNKMATGQDGYPQNPAQLQLLMAQLDGNQAEWISADGFRMMIRTKDFVNEDVTGLETFVEEHDDIRIITGLPTLFDEMNGLVVQSQVQSLGLALGVIFLMLLITIKRLKAALAGLVPTVITILAILGMLSLTGFNLNIMTATLSAIAIGIGIDYSIHLLSSIYRYRDSGLSSREAVIQALSSVSRPILANALGLVAGFTAFFFSPLRLHIHAGAVMWVAMIVSSMVALLLVPIFFSGREKKLSK